MEKEKEADLTISSNFGQDLEQAQEFDKNIKEFLEPLKEKGLIDFKAVLRRKCDFCERTIKKGEEFETIGEKDKCSDCQK